MKGTYSPMVRGVALLRLVSSAELDAFKNYAPDRNPFLLDLPQRLLLLFSLVEQDGSVLAQLYGNLLTTQEFTDRDAGDFLPEIYRDLANQWRPHIRSGDDRDRVQRLVDAAANIEKRRGQQGYSVTCRLEPLADLGLLEKPDPFAYKYRIAPSARTFFERLSAAESADAFAEWEFFAACRDAYSLDAERTDDEDCILASLYQAFLELKSPVNFAPVVDTALLASIRSILEHDCFFEVGQALELLKRTQKERSDLLRFGVDRMGALTYVKFTQAPNAVMVGGSLSTNR
jgi:hypothetical protein